MIATHCLLQRCIYHIATNNHNKENRHKYNDFRAQNVFPAQKVINKIQGDDRKQVEGEGRRFKALKVLKALKALKGFKDLSGLSGPSWLGWLGWPFLPLVSFLIPVPKTHLNFEFTKQATPASCHDCRRQAVGIYQLSSQQSAVSSQQSAISGQQIAHSALFETDAPALRAPPLTQRGTFLLSGIFFNTCAESTPQFSILNFEF